MVGGRFANSNKLLLIWSIQQVLRQVPEERSLYFRAR